MNNTVTTRGSRPGQAAPEKPRPRAARPSPARDMPDRLAGRGPARLRPAAPAPVRPGPGTPQPVRRSPSPRGTARRRSARTRFILLVIGLLGGGLVCLLVINTTLAAGSLQITKLQQSNAAATQRAAQLQQEVASEQSPGSIEQRALRLGLRPQQVLHFVDLRDGRRYSTAANLPAGYHVPGYTP